MTEAEWMACEDPIAMLQWLTPRYRTKNRYRYRTALLFGVACFGRAADGRENSVGWIIRRAEELADGIQDTEPHLSQAHAIIVGRIPALHNLRLLLEPANRLAPTVIASEAAWMAAHQRHLPGSEEAKVAFSAEQVVQADILRDIIGNPFRRACIKTTWLTSDVLALARGIYDWSAFDRMPILADAIQDAGCDSDDILSHCRGPGPHVRGCWVCDLVLGKE